MAEQNPPYVIASGSHSAEEFRRAIGSLVPGNASQVVTASDMAVTQNGTPNMSVNIAAGQAWIYGTSASAQGAYYCFNDATVDLAISASDPSNPRIDAIVAQVQDAAYAGSTDAWRLFVVTGTPTTGATLSNLNGAGAVPASSLVLAYVLVPAAATSVVTADIKNVAPGRYVQTTPTRIINTNYQLGHRARDIRLGAGGRDDGR